MAVEELGGKELCGPLSPTYEELHSRLLVSPVPVLAGQDHAHHCLHCLFHLEGQISEEDTILKIGDPDRLLSPWAPALYQQKPLKKEYLPALSAT